MNLVSAIVTTCKRKPQIVLRAVKSILAQTYPEIEIIVVDDSPNDYPLRNEVMQSVLDCSSKILYLQNEAQSGACYSRNRGLTAAKGDYIAYLDDDDEWLPEKIEKQVQAIEAADEETAMIYCDYYQYDDLSRSDREIKLRKCTGNIYEELMRHGNFCGGLSMPLLKTEALRTIGGFDELLPSGQDYDLWIRLAQRYHVGYIENPWVIYHWNSGNQITKNPKSKIAGNIRILKKNEDYFSSHPKETARMLNKLSVQYAMDTDARKAMATWCEMLSLVPLKFGTNIKTLLQIVKLLVSPRNKCVHTK
ncbi:MAG: glycosyltransferase family 2 protein [Eubacteriales bacterium]|nr:glycosyltransferase family 2 protein [Eubacteriales bacterium]